MSELFDRALRLLQSKRYEESQALFEEIIELVDEKYGNDRAAQLRKAASLANISNILRRTGHIKESLKKRTEALKFQTKLYEIKDEYEQYLRSDILLSKYNLALIHSKLFNLKEAANYMKEVCDKFDDQANTETLNSEFNKEHVLNGYGIIQAQAHNMREAGKWFEKAFNYRKTINTNDKALDFALIAESAINTAKVYLDLEEYPKARDFASAAYQEIVKAESLDNLRFTKDKNKIENLLSQLKKLNNL